MNPTLVLATLRQRFTSPLRVVFLVLLAWMPMIAILMAPRGGFAPLGDCYFIALALAAGMIGQDLSSGTLQLLLARPVTRAQYVFSRWGAVAAGTLAVVVLQLLLATLIMLARGAPVPWAQGALLLGSDVLVALGAAAVVALLSSLASGLGDLGLLLLVFVSAQVLEKVGMFKSWGWLVRGAEELMRVLKPELGLEPFVAGGPVPWLAIVVMNRRELSYASAGS